MGALSPTPSPEPQRHALPALGEDPQAAEPQADSPQVAEPDEVPDEETGGCGALVPRGSMASTAAYIFCPEIRKCGFVHRAVYETALLTWR